VAQRSGSLNAAAAGVWSLKATEGNWAGGLNVRLGRTIDWASKKNMAETMRWPRMIGEEILMGQSRKEKKKKRKKIGKDFLAAKNLKFDSNGFWLQNSSKHMQVGSCSVHLIV
jgi:hypothetical protein